MPGVDVNLSAQNTEPSLILAAKMANGNCVQVLLDHDLTDVAICGELGNVLHTLLRRPIPNRDYDSAFKILLASKHWKKLRGEFFAIKSYKSTNLTCMVPAFF